MLSNFGNSAYKGLIIKMEDLLDGKEAPRMDENGYSHVKDTR